MGETEDAAESSKDLESPVDEENQSTFSIENTEKSPPACDSQLEENHRSAFNKYLESTGKQHYEVEEGSSTQPGSSHGIEEDGNAWKKEDNQGMKKWSNIRDIFDSDS